MMRCAALLLALALTVSCSQQGTHLAYVTAGGNGVYAYRIKNGNGAVTNVFNSPFLPAAATVGFVVHPSNRFAYVTDQQRGTISLLSIDLTSGSLTEKTRTQAGLGPGPMVMDSNGAFLYVADQTLNQILSFSIAADGGLSPVSSVPVGSTPGSLTLSASGFLFVPVANFSSIYVFSASSGSLTQVCAPPGPVCSPFKVNDGIATVATDPAGKFLYVPNPSTNTVSGFVIGSGGILTPVPGVVFAAGTAPVAAVVDPSGQFLYVANSGSTSLSEYSIDSAGDLTAFTSLASTVGSNPTFLLFDPDNEFLYVGNQGSKSITQFFLNSNGTLYSTGNTILVASAPRELAFTR
jgi:6-phosphogluconolactonase